MCITQAELKEVLHYDSNTGLFTRLISNGNNTRKTPYTPNSHGYILINVGGRVYKAHRLAWVYVYGTLNDSDILDHINGIRSDNRITNLRIVSHRTNCGNKEANRNGKLVGTRYNSRHNKWKAQITIESVPHHIGTFDTELDAHNAYMDVLSWVNNGGDVEKILNKYRPPKHLLGTYFSKSHNKWEASICYNGIREYLGRYATEEEAHAAYLKRHAEIKDIRKYQPRTISKVEVK